VPSLVSYRAGDVSDRGTFVCVALMPLQAPLLTALLPEASTPLRAVQRCLPLWSARQGQPRGALLPRVLHTGLFLAHRQDIALAYNDDLLRSRLLLRQCVSPVTVAHARCGR